MRSDSHGGGGRQGGRGGREDRAEDGQNYPNTRNGGNRWPGDTMQADPQSRGRGRGRGEGWGRGRGGMRAGGSRGGRGGHTSDIPEGACSFFYHGSCKYGNDCKNEHVPNPHGHGAGDKRRGEGLQNSDKAKLNKVLSPRERAVAQMKKEAHLKTDRELSLFHDLDGDENNQLDQVELKDLFKKALVLLDQSSKDDAELEKQSAGYAAKAIQDHGLPGQATINFDAFRQVLAANPQHFGPYFRWYMLFNKFRDPATRTIDKAGLCSLMRENEAIASADKDKGPAVILPGCESDPHLLAIQHSGLSNFVTKMIRKFEDESCLDRLRFIDFIKIAQSEYGGLFGYMANHAAGIHTAVSFHYFYQPGGLQPQLAAAGGGGKDVGMEDDEIQISSDPRFNNAVTQAFLRLDKDGNGALDEHEAGQLIRDLYIQKPTAFNQAKLLTSEECKRWTDDLMRNYSEAFVTKGEKKITLPEFCNFAMQESDGDRFGVKSLLLRQAIFNKYAKQVPGKANHEITEGKFVDLVHDALCQHTKRTASPATFKEAKRQAEQFWIKADTNKSGAIDFEEFICWVSEYSGCEEGQHIFSLLSADLVHPAAAAAAAAAGTATIFPIEAVGQVTFDQLAS